MKDLSEKLPVPSYLELSRRGGHLWMFFEESIDGETARYFGLKMSENIADIEVFPKQGRSDGVGSCIRLPFGIHRKSLSRYPFVNPDGSWIGGWYEQMKELSNPRKIPTDYVYSHLIENREKSIIVYKAEEETLSDRVKSAVSVMDYVSQYVDLKTINGGAIGKCPFHDDNKPSFGVNEKGNYWHCFAGCGGGSIIDFYMKMHDVDFKTALKELADELGVSDGKDLHNS